MPTFIVYTSSTCHNCKDLKRFLVDQGVEFEERNISNPQFRTELFELGAMGVPVLYNPSTKAHAVGFNKDKVQEVLWGVE